MSHNNLGFSALEMIVSIAISAILLTAGLTIYNQISSMALRINRITHLDSQILITHQRLNADLNGLVPLWFSKKTYADLKKNKNDKIKDNIEEAPSGTQKNNNFLYAQSSNNILEILTFVTTNALQLLSDSTVRCVRVVYILKPEENKSTFKLMRKQDSTINAEFDVEQLKQGHFYTIADHITQCSIEYGFIKKSDTNKSKFTFVSELGNEKNKEQKKDEDKQPDMPDIIKLTITMQDQNQRHEQKYEIFCRIPTCHATAPEPFAQKRQAQEKPPEKNQQTSTPAPSAPAPTEAIAPNPGMISAAGHHILQGISAQHQPKQGNHAA